MDYAHNATDFAGNRNENVLATSNSPEPMASQTKTSTPDVLPTEKGEALPPATSNPVELLPQSSSTNPPELVVSSGEMLPAISTPQVTVVSPDGNLASSETAEDLSHQLSKMNIEPHIPPSGERGQENQTLTKPPAPDGEFFSPPPPRNPDKYGPKACANMQKCSQLAADFFKGSVKRVRERNQRQAVLDLELQVSANDPRAMERIWNECGRKEGQYLRFLRTTDKPDNYATVKIIGRGAFGEVKLVQRKTDRRVFALKSLVKSEMIQKEQLANVRSERDFLAEVDSPWVVKLYTTFQDAYFLYMLMEFLPGGDLMTMLIKYEIFSEDITRFYMAEIILAIEAVHQLGFIHRDIKPDNVLLDHHGHIKLTDFGLTTGHRRRRDNNYYKQLLDTQPSTPSRDSFVADQISLTVSNRPQINEWRRSRRIMAFSAVGTPDYIAPEILIGSGYSYDCDWWSLGAIMFECLVGWPPFCANDKTETYWKIIRWNESLYFPDDIIISLEAENLIRSLLCNTEIRLGRTSAAELKAHPFFYGVDFSSMRRIRAPFEPRLESNIDTAYFPTDQIDQTGHGSAVAPTPIPGGGHAAESMELSLPFIGYTFKRFGSMI